MRLGIDFGTTRTVVAAALDGRCATVAFEDEGGYRTWLPSAMAQLEGGWVMGEAATARLERAEPGAIRSPKRAISGLAPDEKVPGVEPETSALALTTAYLTWVRESLETRSNLELAKGEPLEAMIAVPANASSRQRYLTVEAFRRAGFEVLGMLNEPTAAAIELAHRNAKIIAPRSPKKYVVVYDLGGGTFDAAAVSLEGRRFELLASEGIARLGGDDFDEALMGLVLERRGIAPEAVSPAERGALLESCRRAKEALSPSSRRVLVETRPAIGASEVVLDVAELYARCEPLVQRTLSLLEQVHGSLVAHGIDPESARELGAIYLVGGAAAFPAVTRALRARFDRKIQLAPEPHAATAVGLAVAADPASALHVREAATRHFGVWREADRGRDTRFDPLLEKGSLPEGGAAIVVERSYRPMHTIGHLRFVECSSLDARGQPAGDLTPWRELLFPYDPALREREDLATCPVQRSDALAEQRIVETYVYEADGSIRVRVENRTQGYQRELIGTLR